MSLRPAGSGGARKKTKKYKAVVDVEEARLWREEGLVEIRKIKREGGLTKKQKEVASAAAAVSSAGCEALDAAAQSPAPDGCQKRDSKPPSLAVERKIKAALSVLQQIIQSDDEEILEDACLALSYLCDGDKRNMQVVTDANIYSRLVELLQHPTPSVLISALRTVGNIVSGDDSQTQIVIDNGVLPYLPQLLAQTHEKSIKREACWTISNITAGNKAQIQAVLDADIIPPLVHLLKHGEFDIKKEAAWAISNVTSGGSFEQIQFLTRQGCIEPLCDLLPCPDSRIVLLCLGALDNILMAGEAERDLGNSGGINVYARWVHECEGLDKVEDLLRHDNREIYEKAVEMLERYWDEEGGEERREGHLQGRGEGLEEQQQQQQHGFESGRDAAVPAAVFKSVMAVSLV